MRVIFNEQWKGYPTGYAMDFPENAVLAALLEEKKVSPVDVSEKAPEAKPAPLPVAEPAPAAEEQPKAKPRRRRGRS